MNIAIIGAGIGGLAAAVACAKAGFEVTLYEQAPMLGEVGAGLQVGPNAVKVLQALGIDLSAATWPTRPDAMRVYTGDSGTEIASIPLGEKARSRYGAPYLHVHRADLLGALHQHFEMAHRGTVVCDKRLVDIAQSEARIMLHFADDSQVSHDLVVGADGLGSSVQALLFGATSARFTGAQAWRTMIPAHDDLPNEVLSPGLWVGNGRHVVTYPLRADGAINVVGVVPAQEPGPESWRQTGDPAQMQAAFADWDGPITQLLDRAEACFAWPLFDRPPLAHWSSGRATLLGDAAHPMLPYLAQGASMAIEDAYVFAACLAQHYGQAGGVARALELYEHRRKGRTSRVQAAARVNGLFYHAGAVANGGLKLANRIGLPSGRSLDWLFDYDVPARAGDLSDKPSSGAEPDTPSPAPPSARAV